MLTVTWSRRCSGQAEAAENDLGLALVVDAELFRLEGVVRWLDAADARLSQVGAIPDSTPVDVLDSGNDDEDGWAPTAGEVRSAGWARFEDQAVGRVDQETLAFGEAFTNPPVGGTG